MIPTTPILVLPDGRRVELDDDIVVGRSPVAPESAPSARPVNISAETVSKTHALIGSDQTGVWVVDLGSSNGTEVMSATGVAERIERGVRVVVPDGHGIRVGTDTMLTLDRGEPDPDRTIVRPATAPPAAPVSSPPPDPAPSSDAVPPPPAPPDVAPPAPDVAPPPAVEPPASPATVDISSVASPQPSFQAPPPPSYQTPSSVPSYEAAPPTSDGSSSGSGLSFVNVVGLIVLVLWGVGATLLIAGLLPDDIASGDGWPIRFFASLSPDELDGLELYGVAEVPSPLRWTTYVGTVGTGVLALASLLTRNRAVRALCTVPVLVAVFFLGGFLVLLMRSEFAVFSDYAESVLPGFVLPLVGLLLSQLPSGSSSTAAPSQPFPSGPPSSSGPPFGASS